ncbi:MAG TPA: amidohydrolase family protein [Solirubrobacteraceae bacterium]|nr:amidohydrolase family protein [Solirubrobacteraceae bacterium]
MAPAVDVFDAHLHIIDPRFPLVAKQGYVPEPFTVDDYRATIDVAGGAVVAGSFQRGDTAFLVDALERLGPTFVGVAELDHATDEEILALDAAGVRAVRFNLHRGGSLDLELARRVHELAGWHVEVYADGATLAALEDRLRELPRLSVDHLGLDAEALPVLQRLGCMVKATGFGRVDLDVEATLRALDPSKLMFGTDLPGTRARRPFEPRDLELVAAVAPQALAENARAWYRPRA